MNKYEFTSTPLGCEVAVTYKEGKLFRFEASSPEFDIEKYREKRYYLYFTELEFLKMVKAQGIVVLKTTVEITFDMFYDRYAHKVDKYQAQKAWDKLSKRDQIEAYLYIPAYEAFRKTNQHNKLYPASYLAARRWIR